MPQPGTIEARCNDCGETYIPDLVEDKILDGSFDKLPAAMKMVSKDWYEHTEKEDGSECGGVGTLTPQSLSRLRHPAHRSRRP